MKINPNHYALERIIRLLTITANRHEGDFYKLRGDVGKVQDIMTKALLELHKEDLLFQELQDFFPQRPLFSDN